jgi:hypothetical protein
MRRHFGTGQQVIQMTTFSDSRKRGGQGKTTTIALIIGRFRWTTTIPDPLLWPRQASLSKRPLRALYVWTCDLAAVYYSLDTDTG